MNRRMKPKRGGRTGSVLGLAVAMAVITACSRDVSLAAARSKDAERQFKELWGV